ncbi:MAG: hypothetical protein V7K39_19175 [Nostoc sp.]
MSRILPSSFETSQLPIIPLRTGTGIDICLEYFDTHSHVRLIVAPIPVRGSGYVKQSYER